MPNPTVKAGIAASSTLRSALWVSPQAESSGVPTKGAWDAVASVHWPVVGNSADLTSVAIGTSGVNALDCANAVDTAIYLAPLNSSAANGNATLWETYGNGPWSIAALIVQDTSGLVALQNRDGWAPNEGFSFGTTADGRIYASHKGAGTVVYAETAINVLAVGEVAVIGATFDQTTATITLKKNGTQVRSDSGSYAPTTWAASERRAGIFDSVARTGGGFQSGNGAVGGVLFWSSILTDAQFATFGSSQADALAGSFYSTAFDGLVAGGDTTAPTITGPAGATTGPGNPTGTSSISVAENTTAVHTFTANEAVTWSLNGGTDVARFQISAGGALSFLVAPNFEIPTDSDTNNTYVVGVRATDAALNETTQVVTVTVTDVAEGDATNPVMTGGLVASNITTTGYTLTWTAGTDNTGITGYERSLNGGSTWTSVGLVLTVNITGRTPGSVDQCRVRAFDAAGNRSNILASDVGLNATSVSTSVISNGSGTPLANTLMNYSFFPAGRLGSLSGITMLEATATTNSTGVLTINGLPAGPGILLISFRATTGTSNSTTDKVYYEAVTVA